MATWPLKVPQASDTTSKKGGTVWAGVIDLDLLDYCSTEEGGKSVSGAQETL